jgi:ubiquinone/menaquinone biosynthesis C-methylase UbiE
MTTGFKDHFSGQAAAYSTFRPTYPTALFDWLADNAPRRDRVWDVGTGSGQAAGALAAHFERVVGTDASSAQVAQASPHPRVEYRVAPAEASGLPAAWADVITVAQALHWFDLPKFFDEAKRVLAPDGLLAVWCYGDPKLDDPAVDRIVHDYNRGTVEKHWPRERDLVLKEYRTIAFPFREISTPSLMLGASWTLPQLAGYLRSWSATACYAKILGRDPVVVVEEELSSVWGTPEAPRVIRWPITIRAGRPGSDEGSAAL